MNSPLVQWGADVQPALDGCLAVDEEVFVARIRFATHVQPALDGCLAVNDEVFVPRIGVAADMQASVDGQCSAGTICPNADLAVGIDDDPVLIAGPQDQRVIWGCSNVAS